MSRFSHFLSKIHYGTFLLGILPFTTLFGLGMGMTKNYEDTDYVAHKKRTITHYTNVIGYTSIGFITGILYPITIPVYAGYTLYQIAKNDENDENDKNDIDTK